jgi:hypothetical protein
MGDFMSSLIVSGDTSGAITLSAPAVAGSGVLTLPVTTDTLVGRATTDTLTNKTLGSTVVQASNAAPAFSAYNSGYQTIATATWTKINCDTENFDTNSNFASSRFTPTVAGYYQFNATILGSASATGFIGGSIYKNGSKAWTGNFIPNSSQGPTTSFSGLLAANGSTDYFELYFYQNSGSNMTAGTGDSTYGFSGSMIRSA